MAQIGTNMRDFSAAYVNYGQHGAPGNFIHSQEHLDLPPSAEPKPNGRLTKEKAWKTQNDELREQRRELRGLLKEAKEKYKRITAEGQQRARQYNERIKSLYMHKNHLEQERDTRNVQIKEMILANSEMAAAMQTRPGETVVFAGEELQTTTPEREVVFLVPETFEVVRVAPWRLLNLVLMDREREKQRVVAVGMAEKVLLERRATFTPAEEEEEDDELTADYVD